MTPVRGHQGDDAVCAAPGKTGSDDQAHQEHEAHGDSEEAELAQHPGAEHRDQEHRDTDHREHQHLAPAQLAQTLQVVLSVVTQNVAFEEAVTDHLTQEPH